MKNTMENSVRIKKIIFVLSLVVVEKMPVLVIKKKVASVQKNMKVNFVLLRNQHVHQKKMIQRDVVEKIEENVVEF